MEKQTEEIIKGCNYVLNEKREDNIKYFSHAQNESKIKVVPLYSIRVSVGKASIILLIILTDMQVILIGFKVSNCKRFND